MARRAFALLALAGVTAGCGPRGRGPDGLGGTGAGPLAEAAALVERYVDETLAERPSLAREAGIHTHDGRVEAVGPEAVAARLARARAHVAAVDGLERSPLPDPVRMDLEITRLDALQTIFELEELEVHRRMLGYAGLFDVSSYLNRDYAPLAERVRALLDHAEALAARAPAILAVQAPRQPKSFLEVARVAIGGVKEYYEGDVAELTRPALEADPALEARYRRVMPAALRAVDQLVAWIDAHQAQATDDFALGEARFLGMLEVNEGMQVSLQELERLAEEDLRRNHQAFVATARAIDPDASTQAVVDRVAADRLPADGVIAAATRQLEELLAFLEAKPVITIGSTERATVKVTPPFMRWNSAFLDPAGPFEEVEGSFYYISPPDPAWPKEVQEAYIPYEGDLLATSIHEVYPGHFVQGLQLRRAQSRAQKIFSSYAFVEGWAHYAEEMMFEAGFGAGDPVRRLGMLSNALLRNCRFLAAIGLHTKGWTVEQADRLFREQCFIDPGNAMQQAQRGTFDPGYLSYTLGKIQIRQLRERFFAARETDSLQAFHDWLLSFGNAPISLIAARLEP